MRKFEELNYYEMFELPVNASSFEVRQAYRHALSIYGEDSNIAYAFFSEEQRAKILHRVEEAFSTLISDSKREAYNKTLVAKNIIDPSSLKSKRQKVPTPLFSSRTPGSDSIAKKIKKVINQSELKQLVDDMLSMDTISGGDLRKLREAAGIKVEELFEVTRISVPTLAAIENDRIEDLPPTVYLRNFLKAYAEFFKAEPQKVIAGYLKNLERLRSSSR